MLTGKQRRDIGEGLDTLTATLGDYKLVIRTRRREPDFTRAPIATP